MVVAKKTSTAKTVAKKRATPVKKRVATKNIAKKVSSDKKVVNQKSNSMGLLMTAYIVLSAIFIGLSAFDYFKNNVYKTGYTQAFIEVYNASIKQESCQSGVPISVLGNSVTLINIACLEQVNQPSSVKNNEEVK